MSEAEQLERWRKILESLRKTQKPHEPVGHPLERAKK